jgi:hypothetical protein
VRQSLSFQALVKFFQRLLHSRSWDSKCRRARPRTPGCNIGLGEITVVRIEERASVVAAADGGGLWKTALAGTVEVVRSAIVVGG